MNTLTSSSPLSPPGAPVRSTVIEVTGLRKRYDDTEVLRDVSFKVFDGELFGLLGTNGAGKTTAVEILQGLRPRDAGQVSVLGLDPGREGDAVRARVGSQLQSASLPPRMRVGEALSFFADLHDYPHSPADLAEQWQLKHLQRRAVEALSGGERQRLFVALALIGRPRLVFLDELTQNLDPVGRRHTWDVVRQVRDQGTTVVLVTHDVEEAERLCDRVAILHNGSIVASGTPSDVARSGGAPIIVSFTDTELDARSLTALPGVRRVTRNGPRIVVCGDGPVLAHVGSHLVSAGRPAADLHAQHPTLEDRFVTLTTRLTSSEGNPQ